MKNLMDQDYRIRNHMKLVHQDLFNRYPVREENPKWPVNGTFLTHFPGYQTDAWSLIEQWWDLRQNVEGDGE